MKVNRKDYLARKIKVILVIMIFPALLLCPKPSLGKSPSAGYTPEYSRLFEKAQREYAQGRWQEALRLLSRIYETEVPVQAFYDTLDRQKMEYLSSMDPKSQITTGNQKYGMGDLTLHFSEVLLPQPDSLHHQIRIQRELPPARLLYLYAVMGRDRGKGGDPLLGPAAPRVNLNKALSSGDPWLVSAALFLARKGQGRIKPRFLIDRWQTRPDLWDDICTEQALLFLAGLKPDELRKLNIKEGYAAEQISDLAPLTGKEPAQAQVLYCWGDNLNSGKGLQVKVAPCNKLKIGRLGNPKKVNIESSKAKQGESAAYKCQQGVVKLSPGEYRLSYQQEKARGNSRPFRAEPGTITRVVLVVRGNV